MIFYQHVPHSVRGMRFCSHERSAFWAENLHEMYVRKRTQKFSKDDKDTVCFWWLSQKSPLMKKPKSQFSTLCKSSLQICKCKRKLYVSTTWKVSRYRFIPRPYFPVFSPNTGKYGPKTTPYFDIFHTVSKKFLHKVYTNLFTKVFFSN